MSEHTYTLTAQESKEFVPSNVFKKTVNCITKSSDYISIGKIGGQTSYVNQVFYSQW